MNQTYEPVTYTPAGQCVVALTIALGGTWSLPEEEGPNVIERAASGDSQAQQVARDLSAPLGALPRTVDLVIGALADARAYASDESDEVQMPILLSALVMRLTGEHYPDVDGLAFAEALMSVRKLETYLLRRLDGDTLPEPTEPAARGMYAFAMGAHNPPDRLADNALAWVTARQADWLDQSIRALRAGQTVK
jgi:hypothetical protein